MDLRARSAEPESETEKTEDDEHTSTSTSIKMEAEAFILITVAPGNEKEALNKLNTHPMVKEAHQVVGPFDILTRVKADTIGNLCEFMNDKIHGMEEVRGAHALLLP